MNSRRLWARLVALNQPSHRTKHQAQKFLNFYLQMTTLFPVSGSFTHYAGRFVDPALGFSLGYNYWYSYGITLPTEITAAALVIEYWNTSVNPAVWITIFSLVVISFNFCGVRFYGEAEFWFTVAKIATILGLLLLSIIITAGGVPGQEPIGFRFWRGERRPTTLTMTQRLTTNYVPKIPGRFSKKMGSLAHGDAF